MSNDWFNGWVESLAVVRMNESFLVFSFVTRVPKNPQNASKVLGTAHKS